MRDPDSKPVVPEPEKLDYACPHGRSGRRVMAWVLGGAVVLTAGFIVIRMLNAPYIDTNMGQCHSNMRRIGMGAIMYANYHDGRFPDDVSTLLQDQDLPPQVFTCPNTNDTPASGSTMRAILVDLKKPGHLSYIYVGKGLTLTTATADTVVLYEPLSNHKDGMNVLFGDGHVEWLTSTEAQAIVKQAAAGVRPIRCPSAAASADTRP